MAATDRLLPLLARALFALPPPRPARARRARPGRRRRPGARRVARRAARRARRASCADLPLDELRARVRRAPSRRCRSARACRSRARTASVAGAVGPLAARLYVPAAAAAPGAAARLLPRRRLGRGLGRDPRAGVPRCSPTSRACACSRSTTASRPSTRSRPRPTTRSPRFRDVARRRRGRSAPTRARLAVGGDSAGRQPRGRHGARAARRPGRARVPAADLSRARHDPQAPVAPGVRRRASCSPRRT